MWSIRALSGPQSGQIFDLKMGKNVLGRSPQCDVKVMSVGVSKEHCEIHVYKDKVVLVDLRSSNGTFLNGVKIQNSIVKLGDKFNLFDVIFDVIPTPEIRPKPVTHQAGMSSLPAVQRSAAPIHQNAVAGYANGAAALQMPYPQMQTQGGVHFQMSTPTATEAATPAPELANQISFKEKAENYIENVVMPAIYKIAAIIPFKQVLLGFVLLLVFMTTLLSVIPLSTITKESNFIEATKRAKSVARALAKQNELALSTGQFISLNVNEALKEDGITEAIIIQQSDGSIIAPSDKAGRETSRPLVTQIRKEPRSFSGQVDSKTIVASFPIGAPDANTGEINVKYHAIVYYNVDNLNVDDGRILSLLMQTLVISSLLGGLIYFLFSRLIQYPLLALNKQIDVALREKNDRVEVLFDYPVFQQVVGNVNLLLNRAMSSISENANSGQGHQNHDVEYTHIVDMISQPTVVISATQTIVALNREFEHLAQVSKDIALQQNYSSVITDVALSQNIEALMSKSVVSPYEKHSDKIPFSQFDCEISIQAVMGTTSQPEYYFITLVRISE